MVTFQDLVVPWSANVGYVGEDTINEGSFWVDRSREPNPEQYGQHFAQLPGTIASVLSQDQTTFAAEGTFQGFTRQRRRQLTGRHRSSRRQIGRNTVEAIRRVRGCFTRDCVRVASAASAILSNGLGSASQRRLAVQRKEFFH